MSFDVSISEAAEADLARLLDFLLDRAETAEDFESAQEAVKNLRTALVSHLALSPFSYRKAGDGRRSTRRELIVPSGATGYVVQFEIENRARVLVLKVRHQREFDYQ